jgi:hypothetical protein
MSTVTFRHENQKSFKQKGVKHLIKESIIDGEKGLSFVLTKKSGDKFHRIYVKELSKDKFEVKEKIDDKESTKEVEIADLKKMLKADKDLTFVKDYIDNERGTYKGKGGAGQCGGDEPPVPQTGGKKKASKKTSKKGSAKAVKKGSAKPVKKSSKKGSRKSSMRGGAMGDTTNEPVPVPQTGGKKKASKK